jgi:hypothetical protein
MAIHLYTDNSQKLLDALYEAIDDGEAPTITPRINHLTECCHNVAGGALRCRFISFALGGCD